MRTARPRWLALLTSPSFTPQEQRILDRARQVGLINAKLRVGYWRWCWCLLLAAALALPSFGLTLLLLPLLWTLQHRRTRDQIEEWALDLREI